MSSEKTIRVKRYIIDCEDCEYSFSVPDELIHACPCCGHFNAIGGVNNSNKFFEGEYKYDIYLKIEDDDDDEDEDDEDDEVKADAENYVDDLLRNGYTICIVCGDVYKKNNPWDKCRWCGC